MYKLMECISVLIMFFLSFAVGLKIVQQLAHRNMFERRKVHFLHEQDVLQTCHFPTPHPEV